MSDIDNKKYQLNWLKLCEKEKNKEEVTIFIDKINNLSNFGFS